MSKTIVVTGGNRGIGYEICRQLATLGHSVILTARDPQKGLRAQQQLQAEGLDTILKMLDVADHESISHFIDDIKTEHQRVDVLINNAAVSQDQGYDSTNIPMDLMQDTINVNFYGIMELTQALLPLIRKSSDGRIVNISSGMGAVSSMGGGYPGYRISKVALNALTQILAADLRGEVTVNSMCPGWVRTGMGGKNAPRSVEKGAETAVWLATAPDIPNGKFLRDKRVILW
ncbi:3-oxoacyl-[acyl-carrier protein] reductase [Fulvivirga imtechensis AK7]|uniref:3-oxoacyl-[acyl-carrier protein] reductase n=1 Tax=Fulvivirga imtechensis AK7 TaxID=1237149 RepID=L8JRH8_9BACT|nr:SDR family oxidoreductase [Fulvivirga imtechensis]ELR71586.1 3-oxoacyl-[acyl-carrier protein] reductase [Fulvivirga imtechensis AK7]